MHANYNPDGDGNSPVSRVRGYYERVKKDNPFTIFSDSGMVLYMQIFPHWKWISIISGSPSG
jgi:hypothetical protein